MENASEPIITAHAVELMDKDETCRFFGGHSRLINHATLYRGVAAERYPRPIKVGANSSRWIKYECAEALAKIIAERDAKAAA
jgi:predicted DNA-binding transcriptional regulator AlpA